MSDYRTFIKDRKQLLDKRQCPECLYWQIPGVAEGHEKGCTLGTPPSDYKVFIALVNREDLLKRALASSADVMENLTVIDNSKDGISFDPGCKVFRAPMPIQFVHSINYSLLETRRQGAHIAMWLHCDAWAPEGAYLKLIEKVREFDAAGRKWGVVFTNYDALVAFNTATIDDVGLWDQHLTWYESDIDAYLRIKLGGYELIDTGIHIEHDYSMTIKSDPEINFINSIVHPLAREYFIRKWGGPPHHETFTTPFGKNGNYA
jgi:hypothetical protein